MTTEERLEELSRLKTAMQEAEKAADDAKAAYKQYEADTWDVMLERGTTSCRVDGDLFVRRRTTFGHIVDEDAFLDWLRETDQWDEFIADKPNKGRLNELVRHLIETQVPEDDWPPGLGSYDRPYIARQKG